jgi:hypothetical protein
MHHPLGSPVPLGGLLEDAHDELRSLGVLHAVTDHVA